MRIFGVVVEVAIMRFALSPLITASTIHDIAKSHPGGIYLYFDSRGALSIYSSAMIDKKLYRPGSWRGRWIPKPLSVARICPNSADSAIGCSVCRESSIAIVNLYEMPR